MKHFRVVCIRFFSSLFFTAVLLAGCAREQSDHFQVRFKVSLSQNVDERALVEQSTLGLPLWHRPDRAGSRWPSKYDDFNCIGINVMGPGIAPSGSAPNRATVDEILAGSRCSYPGVVSDTFALPAGSTGMDLKVRIPGGANRLVQIIGVVNDGSGCPSASTLVGGFSSPYGIFELARQRVDLTQDGQTINLQADYSEASAKEVRCEASVSPSAWCTVPTRTSGNFADGNGSAATPYVFCTERQLREFSFRQTGTEYAAYLKLRSNLAINSSGSPALGRIGVIGNEFKGNFDGDNHTIVYTRTLTGAAEDGLFGYIGDGSASASVSNLKIVGTLTGTATDHVGILAGRALFGSTVSNVAVTGTVSARAKVGGLVGDSSATISNSSSTATVGCSEQYCGGLVGYAAGSISGSMATGKVTSTSSATASAGGFVGYLSGGVSLSAASGEVVASDSNTGGLVGRMSSGASISQSYATGNVTGADVVGGLVGLLATSSSGLSDTYATGAVAGANKVGGLIGERTTTPPVVRSYTTVSSLTKTGADWGALAGWVTAAACANCFSLAGITAGGQGYYDSANATSLSNLKDDNTFKAKGWDFTSATPTWAIPAGGGTPYLKQFVQPTLITGP